MKKFILQFLLLVIVLLIALFVYKTSPSLSGLPFVPAATAFRQIQVGNAQFRVEAADTPEKRSKGLGGRQVLGQDEGMLFIFPESGKHAFWMKGLNFPLDFIWIRRDKVVDITENVLPPTPGQPDSDVPIYQAKEDTDKVLEVNGGTVKRLNIQVGDLVH